MSLSLADIWSFIINFNLLLIPVIIIGLFVIVYATYLWEKISIPKFFEEFFFRLLVIFILFLIILIIVGLFGFDILGSIF